MTTSDSTTSRALNFDVVVLGGGPAGTSGAAAAAVFGQRVWRSLSKPRSVVPAS